jgi:hypothetical protein
MAKWLQDRVHLPLTDEHFELYNVIHRHYFAEMGYFPNLVKCRDFNDRIQWLKLFDQDYDVVRCCDKIRVRDYVRERVGERYLVGLFQIHNRFADIDFDSLPEPFVIKANNDSGTVILVRNKNALDHRAAAHQVDRALQTVYGWEKGEWAYAYIRPKLLIEEFINPVDSVPPADYKFHCVDGVVRFVHYIYDRGLNTKEQIVDLDGNDLPTGLYPKFERGNGFRKPRKWLEMVSVAERLAAGFKYVRVDLFYCAGNIYAGEMTFWPMAGCYHGDGQRVLGSYLDFNRSTYKSVVGVSRRGVSRGTLNIVWPAAE